MGSDKGEDLWLVSVRIRVWGQGRLGSETTGRRHLGWVGTSCAQRPRLPVWPLSALDVWEGAASVEGGGQGEPTGANPAPLSYEQLPAPARH